VVTCSGVSFTHGSNDGQKSIGLIMLTVIGMMPATFSLNPELSGGDLRAIVRAAGQTVPLIREYGDGERDIAVADAGRIGQLLGQVEAMTDVPDPERSRLRDAVYHVN